MSVNSTTVARRCPRCDRLYDNDSEHVCGDGKEVSESDSEISVSISSDGNGEEFMEDLVGSVIGERYSVLSRLSAGGMGVVYKAKHVLLDAEVAIKVLLKPQDPDAQYRFLQEAQLASKIRHPNTVYISDFGLLPDGRSYIVMEFLRGKTLTEEIMRGPMPAQRVCQIGVQIARGLQSVHDKGIIHRDLKPDNIFLIEQDGIKDFVKIVDFGIATLTEGPTINVKFDGIDPNSPEAQRAMRERHTLPGTVLGTPHYMSPEQALGDDVDPRADQYALGCILYEMLSGTVPFDDDNAAALMFKHAYRPPPELSKRFPNLAVPDELEKIVLRTMHKKRTERFAAMRDLEQALAMMIAEISGRSLDPTRPITGQISSLNIKPVSASSSAPSLTPVPPPSITAPAVVAPPRSKRLFLLFGLLCVLTVIGAGIAAYLMRPKRVETVSRLPDQQLLALRRAAIDQLKQDLRNLDPELRSGAVAALGATYDPSLTLLLVELLADKEPSVRMRTSEVLGQLGQKSVAPRLEVLLGAEGEQPVVALAAAEALDQLGDARGQKALRQALAGRHDAAKLRAALYLGGQGDREALKMLNAIVERGKVPEDGAINILSRLAQAGDAPARESLLTRLSNLQNRDLQLHLAGSLVKLGESRGRDFLRDQARRPGPLQLRAASLLASLDEPVEAEPFRAVLAAPSAAPPIRLLALQGLSYVGSATDLPRLQPILADGSEPRVRQGAAVAIVRICDADPQLVASQSAGWAKEAASDPDWLLREDAVAALGDLDSRTGTETLIKLFTRQDADGSVRRQAALALGRRRDEASLSALREGVNDNDAGVQLAARAGLLSRGDEAQRAPLLAAYKNGDDTTRRQIVEEVHGDREILGTALADKTPAVRRVAARKLAALGDKRAVPVLREAASEQPLGPEGLRAYAALRRLGESPGPLPPAAVPSAQSSTDPEMRIAALEALAVQGDEVVRPALERAARDPDRKVRLKVLELATSLAATAPATATATATPVLPGPLLKRLMRDPDLAVRARATALSNQLEAKTTTPAEPKPAPLTEPKPATPTENKPPTPTENPPNPDAGTGEETTDLGKEPTEKTDDKGTPQKPVFTPQAQGRTGREEVLGILRTGSDAFKRKDYRKAQKSLERLSSLCEREPAKVCAPISFDLAYYLGRSYEAEGQLAEAMNEFQRLEGQRGGSPAARGYLGQAVQRLSKKLGRVEVKRPKKGRCQTTIMWVTPGEQEIRLSATEKRTVRVGPNQKTAVGACN